MGYKIRMIEDRCLHMYDSNKFMRMARILIKLTMVYQQITTRCFFRPRIRDPHCRVCNRSRVNGSCMSPSQRLFELLFFLSLSLVKKAVLGWLDAITPHQKNRLLINENQNGGLLLF